MPNASPTNGSPLAYSERSLLYGKNGGSRWETVNCAIVWAMGGGSQPLQDILSFRVVCARINRPFIPSAHLNWPDCCSTTCTTIGHIRPPSTSLLYALHHTILVITISCKGQGGRGCPKNGGACKEQNFFVHESFEINDYRIIGY